MLMKTPHSLVRLLPALLLLAVSIVSRADIVTGRVVDAVSGEPLQDAEVRITQQTDFSTMMSTTKTDSLGIFHTIEGAGRCVLDVSCIGYYPARKVFACGDGKDTLRLGDIALKPSEAMLRVLQVKAKARRFTMSGDTIVFNPAAFQLEEGARLGELLKKLPGVTEKDGQLFWNDKPIRILVNGQEMFANNNILTNQLPAEAVDKIKAYNKTDQFSEHTGHDDGKEDRVLDLQIAPGWLDNWYGDATAKYQTRDHYFAELKAMRFSLNDPVMVYGDINDINFWTRRGINWWSEGSAGNYGREQYGVIAYKHQWKSAQPKVWPSYISMSGDMGHDDNGDDSYSTQETFYPDMPSTYAASYGHSRKHKVNPSFNAYLSWNPDTLNALRVNMKMDYAREVVTTDNQRALYDENPSAYAPEPVHDGFRDPLSAVMQQHLISRQRHYSIVTSDRMKSEMSADFKHYFPDKSQLSMKAAADYTHEVKRGTATRAIDYLRQGAREDYRQDWRNPNYTLNASLAAGYEKWMTAQWMLTAGYAWRYWQGHDAQTMLVDSVFDAANSYRNHHRSHAHALSLGSTINLGDLQLRPGLSFTRQLERMEYTRGRVDTTATRHVWLLAPRLDARWKVSSATFFEGWYQHSKALPALLSTIGYVDDSDPTYITMGNPGLRPAFNYEAGVRYTGNHFKQQRVLTAAFTFSKSIHPQSTRYWYDPQTGVYRSQPVNVPSGERYKMDLNYDKGIGERLRFRQQAAVHWGRAFGYLAQTATAGDAQLNRQRSLLLRLEPKLTYEYHDLELTLRGTMNYDNRRNQWTDDFHLWDYSYGLRALYKWKQFEFQTDFRDESRRGYASPAYNTDRWLWDAGVKWKCLKNKGTVSLEFDDILNQNSYYYANTQAYQRSEYWGDSMHHYLRIGFTYHIDAPKPKK